MRARAFDARDLCAATPLIDIAAEIQPDAGVQSDEQIDEFIRQRVETAYHPSCTCRMGARDDLTVVDPQGRVIGLESCA